MRRCAIVLLCLFFAGVSLYAWSEVTMNVGAVPRITTFEGDARADLGPTRYPSFYSYTSSTRPDCGEYFKTKWVDGGELPGQAAKSGLSLAPLWLKSKYGNGTVYSSKVDYTIVPGLSGKIEIPENYRKSANVLFTWTVRVEGERPSVYVPRPALCTGWYGTSYQKCPEGEVSTTLYINGEKVGQPAVMTIPEAAGVGVSVQNPPPPPPPPRSSDPTQTGSYVLTPEYFGGTFPSSFKVEVRWYNDTSMRVYSPAGMRNLIATIVSRK